MNEKTIEVLNEYAQNKGARTDIIDILAVDFRLKQGAIIDQRGVRGLKEVLVEDYGFSYYYDRDHGHWYIASHPSLLQLVERNHMTPERKQVAMGLFCSYDIDSIMSYIRDEALDRQQVSRITEERFNKFLVSHDCYYPYSPSPTRLDGFFRRAEKRYQLAKMVEPIFDFEFPEFEQEAERKEARV
jgi:hypothetical protein